MKCCIVLNVVEILHLQYIGASRVSRNRFWTMRLVLPDNFKALSSATTGKKFLARMYDHSKLGNLSH